MFQTIHHLQLIETILFQTTAKQKQFLETSEIFFSIFLTLKPKFPEISNLEFFWFSRHFPLTVATLGFNRMPLNFV